MALSAAGEPVYAWIPAAHVEEVALRIELDSLEARVIGCLIEKQITTPDQYPLSLNALVSACNQKSNRDPLMSLDESTVQRTLDALSRKHLVLERSGFGSRVPKYQHLFCNTEFGTLKFSPQELAIVCELLLRGPQTPGELRSRAGRMTSLADVSQVEASLQALQERESGPLVARLPREPGRRESRYMHLFSGEMVPETAAPSVRPAEEPAQSAAGEALEERVARLEAELTSIRAELDELKSGVR
ncbi:MAG TPA: DUF480 domain-containing protein [Steroidobacteraceae bacterium]